MSKLTSNDKCKVYVGGITPNITEADLKQHFDKSDTQTGQSAGAARDWKIARAGWLWMLTNCARIFSLSPVAGTSRSAWM